MDNSIKERIEKVLKNKIGTSYIHEDKKHDVKVFALRGYGRNVLIMYDTELQGKMYTRVVYPTKEMLMVTIEQDQNNYESYLAESVKMMIQLRKKEEPK